MFKTSCFDVWRKEEDLRKIITLCQDLDAQLGGGVPLQLLTEFCGSPGSGKTQMCLQLCINVQLPEVVGGLEGRALFVDTNQGFNVNRLQEISLCAQRRFQRAFPQICVEFNASTILEHVAYIYCADYVELVATVQHIKVLVQQIPKDCLPYWLKLIVIDSFSFALRAIDDVSKRTRINYELLTQLQQLAIDNEIAIVITNELTTRFTPNGAKICPALGETHAHKINQRILLSRHTETAQRVAFVEKSLVSPQVGVPFVIKQSGIS